MRRKILETQLRHAAEVAPFSEEVQGAFGALLAPSAAGSTGGLNAAQGGGLRPGAGTPRKLGVHPEGAQGLGAARQLLVQRAEPGRTWRRPGSSSTAQDPVLGQRLCDERLQADPKVGATAVSLCKAASPSEGVHLRCMSGCVESITHTASGVFREAGEPQSSGRDTGLRSGLFLFSHFIPYYT